MTKEILSWNKVKEHYLNFHQINNFNENMAIDVDFGYWLVNNCIKSDMISNRSNLEIIFEEFNKFKGQFVLTEFHKVERLIAIVDDNFDYYYATFDGKKLNLNSCAGKIIPLKGLIANDDYNYLIKNSELNDMDFLDSDFIERFEKVFKENNKKNKFITELHWKLI